MKELSHADPPGANSNNHLWLLNLLGNPAMAITIPPGLEDLLRNFTIAAIREQPEDLIDFSVAYFTRAREEQRARDVPMYVIVEDDNLPTGEPDPILLRRRTNKNSYKRRRSIAAEHYDPEADCDEDIPFHPKPPEKLLSLRESVTNLWIFNSLEADQLERTLKAMFEKRVHPGDTVIRQGDPGDNFYVIDSGRYEVMIETDGEVKKIQDLEHHGSFGELALMYNMPRSATVTALTEGILWAMDRRSFRKIIVQTAYRKRKLYMELLSQVKVNGQEIMTSLRDYERMNLADALVPRCYGENCQIVKQEDEADGMYFIESGSLRCTITSNGNEQEVGRLSKGQYFGELGLLNNAPRAASVYSVEPVKLAFLDRGAFERLLGPCLSLLRGGTESYKTVTPSVEL